MPELSKSNHVPHLLGRVAEFAAGDTGAQPEPAHADLVHGRAFVPQHPLEVVPPLRHGPDEDRAALPAPEPLDVLARAHDGGLGAQRHLAAPGGQVPRDGPGDDLEQLLGGGGGADGQAVQELDHEAGEALERAGEADGRRDGDERVVRGGNVDLQEAGFVEWGVEEGEETLFLGCGGPGLVLCAFSIGLDGGGGEGEANLVRDVRSGLADVATHLAHDADVLVAVQQGVLLLPGHGADPSGTGGRSDGGGRMAA